jgi:2,3-dihydroxybenzoate-AMP ligase
VTRPSAAAGQPLAGTRPQPPGHAERYLREGYWTGETLAGLVREIARADGSRPAVVTMDTCLSYRDLDQRADRLAAGLHGLGVRVRDRFVVQLPNIPDLIVACLALFRAGAVPVLTLAAHRRAEIGYLCGHAEATGLIIPDTHLGFDHRALAREITAGQPGLRHVLVAGDPGEFTALADVSAAPADLPEPDPADIALFLLSGGTTGLPKLIPRTHHEYLCQIRGTAWEMGLDASGAYLAALPAAHNAALGCPGVLGALRAGAKVVLAASPAPDEVFPLIAREGVTLTTLMPAFLGLWTAEADLFDVDMSRLTIEVGGARCEPELAAAAERALGCTVTRWFGMAEGLLCFTRSADPPQVRLATEGRPLYPADQLRVTDPAGADVPPGTVGELLARGPYTFTGYYRAAEYNAQVFTPDGYFRTGDLVHLTADRNLVVDGRIKDVINRAGEKVPAGEVEEHLRAHPKVTDVAVTGVPDDGLGERSCAFVIPAAEPPSLAELRGFLTAAGLAGYKLPDQLELVTSLPYTPVGKVDKHALRSGVIAP